MIKIRKKSKDQDRALKDFCSYRQTSGACRTDFEALERPEKCDLIVATNWPCTPIAFSFARRVLLSTRSKAFLKLKKERAWVSEDFLIICSF